MYRNSHSNPSQYFLEDAQPNTLRGPQKFFTANSRATMSNNLMLMLSCVLHVSKSPCHGLGSTHARLSGRVPLIGQDCSPVTFFLCNESGTTAVHTSSVHSFFLIRVVRGPSPAYNFPFSRASSISSAGGFLDVA